MMLHFAKTMLLWGLVVVLFSACGRKQAKQISEDNVVLPIQIDTTSQIVQPPPVKPLPPIAIQIAGLQQTGCYGKCPIFEYKVFNDGRVTYIGRKFVEKMGVYEANLPTELINQIIAYADLIGFFSMPDRFPDQAKDIVDLPSTVSFIRKDGEEKKVVNRYDPPKPLRDFEAYFLNIMNSLDWELIN